LVDPSFAVIGSPFWSDILLMMGGMGCFISSAITMLVFFPRSMTSEAGYKAHALSHNSKANAGAATELPDYERHDSPLPASPKSMTSVDRSPVHAFHFSERMPEVRVPAEDDMLPQHYRPRPPSGSRSDDTMWDGARKPAASTSASQLDQNDNFRAPMFINGTPIYVEEVSPSPPYPLVHPYAMNFTSPIDLLEDAS